MAEKTPSTPFAKANSYVGRTLSRLGAKSAVAGRGRYTDDVDRPRLLHAAFVRSPYAHARILDIEVEAARRQPGVALLLTGSDLKKSAPGPGSARLAAFPA